ncbi:MAG: RapZ C-terminal domain-containing protein, partial [Sulfobacillus sp.]
LAPLPGTDARVMAFVLHDQSARRLVGRMEALIRDYLGHLEDDARSDFTVAIGCTGGHHRSVAVVEHLASRLSSDYSPVTVSHRDLEKEELASAT